MKLQKDPFEYQIFGLIAIQGVAVYPNHDWFRLLDPTETELGFRNSNAKIGAA